jgi:hypothetical protein
VNYPLIGSSGNVMTGSNVSSSSNPRPCSAASRDGGSGSKQQRGSGGPIEAGGLLHVQGGRPPSGNGRPSSAGRLGRSGSNQALGSGRRGSGAGNDSASVASMAGYTVASVGNRNRSAVQKQPQQGIHDASGASSATSTIRLSYGMQVGNR